MKRILVASLALLLLLLTGARALASPPDILVIVADDLGWRDIDASIPTPSLDALRARGVSFPRAYANANCSPSRFTALFGRYGRRDGIGTIVVPRGSRAPEENPSAPLALVSLPEILKQVEPHPYVSAAFGKWHLSNELQGGTGTLAEAPRLHGFDRYLAGSIYGVGERGYSDWSRVDDGVTTRSREYNTEAIFEEARLWWAGTPGPKFAWVASNAPHAPFHRPPARLLPPGYVIGPGNRGRFEAAVVALDHEIGRLLEIVDLRHTVVVFLGDNGTPQDATAPDQSPFRVKGSMFDGGVAVPFVVAGAGVKKGGRESRALVNTVDLYATLADLAGVRRPHSGIDGVSFRGCLRSAHCVGRRHYAFSEFFRWNGLEFPKPFDLHMLRSRTHKLMVINGWELLFDMKKDPGEQHPLDLAALGRRETVMYRMLRRRLDQLLLEITPPEPTASP